MSAKVGVTTATRRKPAIVLIRRLYLRGFRAKPRLTPRVDLM
jgi:hypothetical protein